MVDDTWNSKRKNHKIHCKGFQRMFTNHKKTEILKKNPSQKDFENKVQF